MIRLEDVSKSYHGKLALHPLTLDIPRGRTTVLLGPSGCSKSTLIRIIIGLVSPDSGRVLIDGVPLTRDNVLEVRQRMGYVIQEGGLFPHLTAYDNAALMPRYLGWSEERIAARIEELIALTQLPSDAMQRYPLQLSGGQRQRVSLVRALVLDPDVLLLDEPLGALDPLIRADLQQDLRKIFALVHKTVVLVTHDIGEAAYLADTVVMLKDGRIIQQGALADLAEQPADPFVTRFIAAQRIPAFGREALP
jgi:osmoprotectant transport system ATP-binding protein